MIPPRQCASLLLLAAALGAQETDLAAVARDPSAESEARCTALATLQDRRALDVATVLAALGDADESVAAAAAAIVRHEWVALPDELLRRLDNAPLAARRLLYELAIAPRPSVAPWIETWIASDVERPADDRCLALAACGRPMRPAEGELMLRALIAGEAGDGCLLAMQLAPPSVADALCGRLHAAIERGQVPVDSLVPLLDRMTGKGRRSLLSLATTLPEESGRSIARRVADVDPELVRERAREMLDGDEAVSAVWLDHAGPLMDHPARRERVEAVLRAADAKPALRELAFAVLVDAGAIGADVLEFAADDEAGERARHLLRSAVDRVPERLLVAWLDTAPPLSTWTVQALVRRKPLGGQVEADLRRRLLAAEWDDGPFFTAAATAIVQQGSETVLDALWPRFRTAPAFADLVDALSRRREPFVHELLLAELGAERSRDVSEARDEERRDTVRLALVALGDRRQLRELVAHAAERSPAFVRRCTHYARPLDGPYAATLLDAVAAVVDVDLAVEMVAWAATSDERVIAEHLWRLYRASDDTPIAEALREVAVRALASGPFRARLQDELRIALAAGPLPQRLEPVCFELVASGGSPLSPGDVRFLAELMLEAPLTDPDAERRRRDRWPDGRAGFPLVAAIAQRLRGTPPQTVQPVFADVADKVARDPRRAALSRQRILAGWRSLEADRALMAAVAVPTAPLLLELPDDAGTGQGPAHFFCMLAAEARGEPMAAAAHARAAIAGILRLPTDWRAARLFLGEREPAAGRDPWAALSAAPHLQDHRAALARGDEKAAAAAAALVREFAGRDEASLAGLPAASQEDLHR